jgi:hypothetical protein
MVSKIRFALGAMALIVPAWLMVKAADTPAPRTTGHVLVLENGRTLEGDIDREGDQYRVRRSVGETWVSSDKALHLCENLEEAYEYLKRQANLRDADERVRLARWCQQHALRAQALAEITAAVELQPKNPELRRLLANLQRLVANTSATSPASIDGNEVNGTSDAVPTVDLTAESVSHFITKVQPILMNTCAHCHASGHGGSFRLARAYDGSSNHRVSQHNLAAVVEQINKNDNWQLSPLLTKAVSVHGEAGQPPLKSRKTKAFETLEEWVRQVVENNPQLRGRSDNSTSNPKVPESAKPGPLGAGLGKAETTPAKLEFAAAAIASSTVPKPVESTPAALGPKPSAPSGPKDPFDPAIFNGQAHPN